MIVTNKEDYEPLTIDARQILDLTQTVDFTQVLMKDGTHHFVDEKEYHIKSLMLVELTYTRRTNEKV